MALSLTPCCIFTPVSILDSNPDTTFVPVDIIAEPARKPLIPFFDDVKISATKGGALGAGISGSGPTIFALCKGDEIAKAVYKSVEESYKNTGIDFEMFISKINPEGIRIIK